MIRWLHAVFVGVYFGSKLDGYTAAQAVKRAALALWQVLGE